MHSAIILLTIKCKVCHFCASSCTKRHCKNNDHFPECSRNNNLPLVNQPESPVSNLYI